MSGFDLFWTILVLIGVMILLHFLLFLMLRSLNPGRVAGNCGPFPGYERSGQRDMPSIQTDSWLTSWMLQHIRRSRQFPAIDPYPMRNEGETNV